jgi:hypothetical protein
MPIVITDNKFCYSVYYPESKVLHSKYTGRPTQNLVLEHYNGTMNLINENSVIGTLIDLRQMYGSYFKYVELLAGDAYPKMKRKGLKYLAFIISDDILVKNVTDKLVDAIERLGLVVEVFTDFDEAEDWLLSEAGGR